MGQNKRRCTLNSTLFNLNHHPSAPCPLPPTLHLPHWYNLMHNIINRLFPKHCISCSQQWDYLCLPCKRKLSPHPEICPYCHRASKDYATCLDCKMEKENYLEWIIIPFAYTDEVKKLILKVKYYHKKDVINFLVDRMIIALQTNQILQQNLENPAFCTLHSALISFVPSHRYRRLFVKGYNQSELLAKNLASKLSLECKQFVRKTKRTKSQAQLSRAGRLKNLKGAFSLDSKNSLNGNETILLVDDVTTTWSTLNQIAKVIKTEFPKIKIRGIVIARHMG